MLMLQMHLTFTFVAGQVPWLIRPIVGAVVSGVQVSRSTAGWALNGSEILSQTTYINVQVQQMVDLVSSTSVSPSTPANQPDFR